MSSLKDEVKRKERELRVLEQAQFLMRMKNVAFWVLFIVAVVLAYVGYEISNRYQPEGFAQFMLLYLDTISQCFEGFDVCQVHVLGEKYL